MKFEEPESEVSKYVDDETLIRAVKTTVMMLEEAIRNFGLDDGSPSVITSFCLTLDKPQILHESKVVIPDEIYGDREFFYKLGRVLVKQGSVPMCTTVFMPIIEEDGAYRFVVVSRNVNGATRSASVYTERTYEGTWETRFVAYDDEESDDDVEVQASIDEMFEGARDQRAEIDRERILKFSVN